MTARELADAVNQGGLYEKRDGSPVEPSQVHARVHKYGRLFIRENGRVRLRDPNPPVHDTALLARFDAAMLEVYEAAFREVRYPARRFLDMLRRRGGLEAAQHLLATAGASEGFTRLAEAGKLDLTMEFQVLQPQFRELFTDNKHRVPVDASLKEVCPRTASRIPVAPSERQTGPNECAERRVAV